MFTGIIQDQCSVVAVDDSDGIRHLTIDLGSTGRGLELGASVANNGVCLTAARTDGTRVQFDVISETSELTNLGSLVVGDLVNIERSLRLGDELGGHMVSGHVAGTLTADEITRDGANRTIWFKVDPEHMNFLFWKGFVALDGASLTISAVDRGEDRIAVSLIPETIERTSLGRAQVGDRVNVELDAQTQATVQTVRQVLRDRELLSQILEDN